ncbi:unnamed protein product, partial [Mesorhabditis belari]|uniref:asparaginase n=1 Tax=Mesorhabditis belari TaxID=2138241 RepID=A0AAF3FCK7_9BILA
MSRLLNKINNKKRKHRPIDESHTPKNLTVLTGSYRKVLSATELAQELQDYKSGLAAKVGSVPANHLPEGKVLVLYTGGTIGMKSVNGVYSPVPGYLPEVLRTIPPLNDREYVEKEYGLVGPNSIQPYALPPVKHMKKRVVYWIVEYDPLLDSCDMTFDDWIRIATDIKKAYHHYDGFVVLHGTDTLAYTSSALSFMMENLGKPVIITGSQIPVAEVRSDGMDNLVGSLIIAGNFDIPEVAVVFNNKLMRGNRTMKLDNSALDAFVCPNMHPLAEMNINIKVYYEAIFRSGSIAPFNVHEDLCRDVGMLRLFPSMSIQTVRAFLAEPIKGVVLQTFGSGNMPSKRTDIIEALKSAVARGVLIVNCTQCIKGQVDVHYETGKILYDIGVIPGSDMTSEAAMTKLCYIIGKDDWDHQTKMKMLQTNLRGELTITQQELKQNEIITHIARYLRLSSIQEIQVVRNSLLPPLICQAAKEGNVETLETLRESGGHFSYQDYDGRTPLHVAASWGQKDAVEYLLKHGANVHVKDRWNCNAILCAIRARNIDVVRVIKEAGGRIDGNPKETGMELCFAASQGDFSLLECFAAAGADLRSTDYDGRTALHLASSNGHLDVVEYLLERGLNARKKDHFGNTALDEATKGKHDKVETVLLRSLSMKKSTGENDGILFKIDPFPSPPQG